MLRLVYTAMVFSVTACATPLPSPPAPVELRDLAGEVRSEAASQESVVEVFPLADPVAIELVDRARAAEASGDLNIAAEFVTLALEIAPKDPEYWQYLAELNLKQHQYHSALEQAQRSYRLGPQVGQLCYRNWLTVNRSLAAQGDSEGAENAQRYAAACTVKPRVSL